ncbi:TPA: hypothetical protein ENS27_09095 [bacterium]|nr:hypothetical protein [bacterium]
MDNLNELLIQIKEKISNYHSIYEQNEMAVRDQIINPILINLGWDTANPTEVLPNMSIEEGGIPDYSLIKDGKTILFLEAKKMSVDIEKNEIMGQLAYYSFNEGKGYGVLTNGIAWILIRSFEEETKLHERIVWKTDIEKEEPSKVIRKLITISKTNIEQIGILVKKIQILDNIWQSLLNKPEEIVTGLLLVVESIISQDYSKYQFENSEIEDFLKEKIRELILGGNDNNDDDDKNNNDDDNDDNDGRQFFPTDLPPNGTMCQFAYKGSQYNGTIKDGKLVVEKFGKFTSFSGASKKITKTSLNGWRYWEIKLPGDSKWQLADTWRKS